MADPKRSLTVPTSAAGWDALEAALTKVVCDTFAKRTKHTVTSWAEAVAIVPATSGQPKPGPYRCHNGPAMRAV